MLVTLVACQAPKQMMSPRTSTTSQVQTKSENCYKFRNWNPHSPRETWDAKGGEKKGLISLHCCCCWVRGNLQIPLSSCLLPLITWVTKFTWFCEQSQQSVARTAAGIRGSTRPFYLSSADQTGRRAGRLMEISNSLNLWFGRDGLWHWTRYVRNSISPQTMNFLKRLEKVVLGVN